MTLNLSILTKSELKLRKLWRKCFLIIYSLIVFFVLVGGAIASEGDPYELGRTTMAGVFIFLPSFIFYHCAYKKAGTRLLTLYLYFKPIEFLVKGLVICFFPFPWNIIIVGVVFCIMAFFYTLNWKLRKINKNLQLNMIYPEEYILATNTLESAASQDTLDFVYSSLVQTWPQFEKHSTRLRKQRLQALTK